MKKEKVIKENRVRCEGCEVLLMKRGLVYASFENPKRCDDCLHFEDRIKNECVTCGSKFVNSISYFKVDGNFCKNCMREVCLALKAKRKTRKKDV